MIALLIDRHPDFVIMRIYNYNKEGKEKGHEGFYLKFGLFGALLAFVFIGGFKLLGFLLRLIVKYWIWVIVIIAAAFLARYFFLRRRR